MDICYPDTTDWSCAYSDEDLATMRTDPVQAAALARSEALAWSTLARLTGYRLSLCPVTIRPCAERCLPGLYAPIPTSDFAPQGGVFSPYMMNGSWYNGCGCGSSRSCSCTTIQEVRLPMPGEGPVTVQIDGATLDPSVYRIDNRLWLVRQDGGTWPLCQDMNLPVGAVGTFSVTYHPGIGPDSMLSYAAGVLAVEFFRACQSDGKCRLPSSVRRVVRQGVMFELAGGFLEDGTGIREVDAIIDNYNPNRLRTPSRVVSIDSLRGRVTTTRGL